MAYILRMEIIETSIFTKSIIDLLPDDEYKMLQHYLVSRPDAGALIIGGGIRTIYYWNHDESIYMLLCYRKNEQENITPKQLSVLRMYVKENLI